MAMLPQSYVGQMDREIQTRPPAERQSQLPKYLLSCVCTTINANSSPHSAAYMRRWIGSALLQIMVCRLFGTKPSSEQTFRYSQELSPGPLVYIWTNFSEILIKIENFLFTEMHLNISSVKWQPFSQGGGGWVNWTRIKHAVWPSKCIFNTHLDAHMEVSFMMPAWYLNDL